VTGDCHAGICGSPGVRSPGLPDPEPRCCYLTLLLPDPAQLAGAWKSSAGATSREKVPMSTIPGHYPQAL